MIAKWLAVLLVACILGGGAIPARAHQDHRQTTHGGGWPFHGDPAVEISLILATALATDQRPAAVRRQIAEGVSVARIAANHGITADAVLQRQAALIDAWLAHAVERGRLPRALADARAAWLKQAARLQIGQPGLQPRFPGLHELHVVMITAAVQTSGLPRRDVRTQLASCGTLAEIAAEAGTTREEVVAAVMGLLEAGLNSAVTSGELTATQRDSWQAALHKAANTMVDTPGLHVAGKECAT